MTRYRQDKFAHFNRAPTRHGVKTLDHPPTPQKKRREAGSPYTAIGFGGRGGTEEGYIPIPRDATSVATIIGDFPVLNSFRTQSRSFCCLSPWMAGERTSFVSIVPGERLTQRRQVEGKGENIQSAGQPSWRRKRVISSATRLVPTKMRHLWFLSPMISSKCLIILSRFSDSPTTSTT